MPGGRAGLVGGFTPPGSLMGCYARVHPLNPLLIHIRGVFSPSEVSLHGSTCSPSGTVVPFCLTCSVRPALALPKQKHTVSVQKHTVCASQRRPPLCFPVCCLRGTCLLLHVGAVCRSPCGVPARRTAGAPTAGLWLPLFMDIEDFRVGAPGLGLLGGSTGQRATDVSPGVTQAWLCPTGAV